jgi:hypothetical protein
MAGLGRRTFAPGEVLTASNVMNYLQDQVIQTYAGTAARGSAIGTALSEGMVSYLADTNSLEFYDSTAWQYVAGTAASAASLLQAQTNLGVKVIGVYSAQMTAVQSFTGAQNALTDLTGLSVTLTPKSVDSKFLIFGTAFMAMGTATVRTFVRAVVLRGATNIADTQTGYTRDDDANMAVPVVFSVLDSPNTTSSITYKIQGGQFSTASVTVYVNRNEANTTVRGLSFFHVLEVVV